MLEWRRYRQRGRGESIFGSLTNEFGDRLKTVLVETSITRIGCRFAIYLVKLCMRMKIAGEGYFGYLLVGVIRHVRNC